MILEQEIVELKIRVERLEALIYQIVHGAFRTTQPTLAGSLDHESLVAWLKTQGLVRDPTVEEHRLAAAWDALSAEEQQAHIRFMQSLILTPPLSQIIIEQRH